MNLAQYFRQADLPVPADWANKVSMQLTPAAHQVSGLALMAKHTRFGLYDDPGTGKTLQIQGYCLWLVGLGNKVVCTMAPVLVPQFYQSLIDKYQGCDEFVKIAVLQGTPEKRKALIETWESSDFPDILVLSYKMFVQYMPMLRKSGYTAVIVDEATAVKSPSSQLHEAVKTFAGDHRRDSNGVVLVTGTPVETNVVDAYGLIAITNPDRYGSKHFFERVHCTMISQPVKWDGDGNPTKSVNQIVGYKNLDLLNESLFISGRRVKKSDVSDLPPRLVTEIPVQLSHSHGGLYKRIVNERVAEIGPRVIDLTEATAIYQALQRLLFHPEQYTDKAIDNSLLEALDAVMASLSGRKVVVYCWYQATVEKLADRYKDLNPAVLYGKTSPAQREVQKNKFISDASCQVILANPRSGGVGVDGFQHVCSHVVFAEVCPFPGLMQQSVDRLHRTGQAANSVNVYLLIPTGTIAVKLRNDLVRKDAQQELVVKDGRTVLYNLMGEQGLQGSIDALWSGDAQGSMDISEADFTESDPIDIGQKAA